MWKPAVKNRVTERVLDRLSYEWDSASRTFAPVVTDELIKDVQRAADTIIPAFDTKLSESLHKQLQEWCELHGIGSIETGPVQRTVARHAILKRKRRDFLHKLSAYYAREYDLVAVEDLDAKGLVELPGNSRNRAGAAWGTFLRMLEYKCEREGTHFVAVEPAGTTKECAGCGVETDKPLWAREHSCPACGFTADRDSVDHIDSCVISSDGGESD